MVRFSEQPLNPDTYFNEDADEFIGLQCAVKGPKAIFDQLQSANKLSLRAFYLIFQRCSVTMAYRGTSLKTQ